MPHETTLIIIKPDGLQRRLVGEVIGRFERKGLVLRGLKLMRITGELADKHYAEHTSKPFYKGLRAFITSGPVVVAAISGKNAIAVGRTLVGSTDAGAAAPGTIRGDLGLSKSHNVVHASDGPEAAQREIALYFGPGELHGAEMADHPWVYDLAEDR